MPIPIDNLKKKIELDEDHEAVYDFLKNHTDYAYSELEIIQELNNYIFNKVNKPLASFEKQKLLELFKLNKKLEKLLNLGYIKKFIDNDKEYFSIENVK